MRQFAQAWPPGVILSLAVSGQYDFFFRNAALVVSRTLMRFSLLTEQPTAVIFATAGMVFAILHPERAKLPW